MPVGRAHTHTPTPVLLFPLSPRAPLSSSMFKRIFGQGNGGGGGGGGNSTTRTVDAIQKLGEVRREGGAGEGRPARVGRGASARRCVHASLQHAPPCSGEHGLATWLWLGRGPAGGAGQWWRSKQTNAPPRSDASAALLDPRCPSPTHPPPPPPHPTHPLPPTQTEELLIKRRGLLEKKIAAELGKAREQTLAKNKRAALMALKKKKMYETQLEQVENNILRVNEQQMMLENQRTTVETVSALRNAAQASKQTMSEMKINDVDSVLDEINEQTDQMQQIQDAMAQPIGAAADLDEDELLGELEELESQQLDSELLAPAPAPSAKVPAAKAPAAAVAAKEEALPAVPKGRAGKAPMSAEEAELAALEAEMAQ